MKISCLILLILGLSIETIDAQTSLGINGPKPTEKTDVKSVLRVRSLPNDGTNSIYTTGQNTSSSTPNQPFIANNPIAAEQNFGIIGQASKSVLVPNNKASQFNTTDDSSAMFVIKRYTVSDWPNGQDNGNGFDTQMSTTNWEAFLSNVSYNMKFIDNLPDVFINTEKHGWEMQAGPNSRWRIKGDIRGVQEGPAIIDVLFIKKGVIASENRTAIQP